MPEAHANDQSLQSPQKQSDEIPDKNGSLRLGLSGFKLHTEKQGSEPSKQADYTPVRSGTLEVFQSQA